ncbi:arylamine N-acetyltransferase family protein [Nocardioides bizhenqiangii]|uniref:Arylamine N-acetyltransferase n=1 Tax=Nocardioides bizhenqiangii TaxID=3095076 RepID=A0ABZ0ZNB4_9ACTN|nr:MULTISPECIES: arylamine N-acetyltransferase [unclassified Nocardioides]MDZ5621362.1 arylamine N-acetyltransferase [Nocardioides sp. HM23]WQQ25798.1 arylamine N-acetyltransferase [Nocardioides sp. HM61]
MTQDPWQIDRLDLDGYLGRLGVPERSPGREALDELHEAHVRTFTFDNIDVLLEQHPGVGIDVLNDKFVGRGRGGYCFEHGTVFAAALERLGYDVQRRLGRVGDPAAGPVQGRTHMTVEVWLDGQRLLCDPGFGMSLVRPVALEDGAESDQRGWPYRVTRTPDGGWGLHRRREQGWEHTHTVDELPVLPVDVVMGHHYTSTFPTSHFRSGLMITKHEDGQHVTVTATALTVRRPGLPTEHRDLAPGELNDWLSALDVPLTSDEKSRLLAWVSDPRR